MPNYSKIKDARQWKKWRASGAIAHKQFEPGALVIDAMCHFSSGPAAGHTTLSLGRKMNANGWTPLCAVVVLQDERYKIGLVLDRIPGNAVPVGEFFGSE